MPPERIGNADRPALKHRAKADRLKPVGNLGRNTQGPFRGQR
jgi:hypothetical protein